MDLKKEFFQEADKAIAEFDSIYDFFKVAKSHNAYQDGARYEKYKKQKQNAIICNHREVCRFCRNRSAL